MKKTSQLKASLILFLGLTLISCSSMNRSIKESSIQIDFNRNDFELTEQISAKAKQIKVFGIDWTRLFHSENGSLSKSTVIGTNTKIGVVDSYAISELLKNNPGFDVVFYPYFERKQKRFLIFFFKKEVLVKARLGKIK